MATTFCMSYTNDQYQQNNTQIEAGRVGVSESESERERESGY
jgi:hypothetical protein